MIRTTLFSSLSFCVRQDCTFFLLFIPVHRG